MAGLVAGARRGRKCVEAPIRERLEKIAGPQGPVDLHPCKSIRHFQRLMALQCNIN
jgi:hypothetical protein